MPEMFIMHTQRNLQNPETIYQLAKKISQNHTMENKRKCYVFIGAQYIKHILKLVPTSCCEVSFLAEKREIWEIFIL